MKQVGEPEQGHHHKDFIVYLLLKVMSRLPEELCVLVRRACWQPWTSQITPQDAFIRRTEEWQVAVECGLMEITEKSCLAYVFALLGTSATIMIARGASR